MGRLVNTSSSAEVFWPNSSCAFFALFFKLRPTVAINPPEIGIMAMANRVNFGLIVKSSTKVPIIIKGSRTKPSIPLSIDHSISFRSAVARVNISPFLRSLCLRKLRAIHLSCNCCLRYATTPFLTGARVNRAAYRLMFLRIKMQKVMATVAWRVLDAPCCAL